MNTPLGQPDYKYQANTDYDQERQLVLYNDDVNTFDHVINSLVEVCSHDERQAEQCALITHYKGKCSVLSGSHSELEPKKNQLNHRGLSAEIH